MKIEKRRLLINLCSPLLALAPHHHTIQVAHTPPSSPILLALEAVRSSLLSGPDTYFNLISEQLLSSLLSTSIQSNLKTTFHPLSLHFTSPPPTLNHPLRSCNKFEKEICICRSFRHSILVPAMTNQMWIAVTLSGVTESDRRCSLEPQMWHIN